MLFRVSRKLGFCWQEPCSVRTSSTKRRDFFRSALEEPLPTTGTLAWANIGLGEISLKRGQAVEAARHFSDAITASRDYPSSLAARAARIRAEATANNAPAVDESAKAFLAQLSQAIVSGKKAEPDRRVVPGELVRFVNGIVGTQPEIWETRVLRTELLDTNLLAADVSIRSKTTRTRSNRHRSIVTLANCWWLETLRKWNSSKSVKRGLPLPSSSLGQYGRSHVS